MSKVLFQTIQLGISTQFQCQNQFYFKQFSLAYAHSILSSATILGESGPGSDGNKGVFRIT